MLLFRDSLVYNTWIDPNGECTKKIISILNDKKKTVINDYCGRILTDVARLGLNSVLTQKAVTMVRNKEILLFVLPRELQLPKPLPFVKYTDAQGSDKVFIDVSRFAKLISGPGETPEYTMDFRVFTTLITSAFVTLEFVDKNALLPADVIKYSAAIWANMFCKVLNGLIQLSTNQDRYYAYFYMCLKFYVLHLMGGSEALADSIADGYIARMYGGKKESNTFLTTMEAVIKMRQMKPFESIESFCYTLFDDEVGNLKGIKVANIKGHVNTYEFVHRFAKMYQLESMMSLGSFPYFYMTLMSAFSGDRMVNSRTLGDIVKDDPEKNYVKMNTALIKNVKR